MNRNIDNLMVHCSDSFFGDAKTIDGWHKEKGWREIGYHWVVLNGQITPTYFDSFKNGLIEPGRSLNNDTLISENEVGAHALGYNQNSIGACIIGGYKGSKVYFTLSQYWSTMILAGMCRLWIPNIKILGHNETGAQKACPVINMNLFRERVNELLVGNMSFEYLKKDIKNRGI